MGGPREGRRRTSGRARDAGGRWRARREARAGAARGAVSACARWRRNSARRLRRARKRKGSPPMSSIADDLPELVIGDRVRLRAALENLIDNAVKFTEHGRVGLSVDAARGAARAASAQLRGDRQRHRAVEGGDRAAVPAVQAGECRHRAPVRRLGPGACFRAAARQGDGRRSHGEEPRRTGQHVYVHASRSPRHRQRRRASARVRTASALRAREPFACSARRTIRMRASCSTRS